MFYFLYFLFIDTSSRLAVQSLWPTHQTQGKTHHCLKSRLEVAIDEKDHAQIHASKAQCWDFGGI